MHQLVPPKLPVGPLLCQPGFRVPQRPSSASQARTQPGSKVRSRAAAGRVVVHSQFSSALASVSTADCRIIVESQSVWNDRSPSAAKVPASNMLQVWPLMSNAMKASIGILSAMLLQPLLRLCEKTQSIGSTISASDAAFPAALCEIVKVIEWIGWSANRVTFSPDKKQPPPFIKGGVINMLPWLCQPGSVAVMSAHRNTERWH